MADPKLVLAYLIAGAADLADFLFFYVFGLPGLGRFCDLVTFILLIPLVGKYALFSVVETIPVLGDLTNPIPWHTIGVAVSQTEAFGSKWDFADWTKGET